MTYVWSQDHSSRVTVSTSTGICIFYGIIPRAPVCYLLFQSDVGALFFSSCATPPGTSRGEPCIGYIVCKRNANVAGTTIYSMYTGHWLAVALLRGRNNWVKIAVFRNSRREAGCAQRKNAVFGAQRFSPPAKIKKKKMLHAFFLPEVKETFAKHFFSNSPCRRFFFKAEKKGTFFYIAVAVKKKKGAFRYSP